MGLAGSLEFAGAGNGTGFLSGGSKEAIIGVVGGAIFPRIQGYD